MKFIQIAQPHIDSMSKRAVLDVMSSGAIIQGEKVDEFEKKFAKFTGVKYAVAVSSGTAALHLALMSLDLKSQDEVITTPFSFIASANAIILAGAKPVFVDINPKTFNIDPYEIEKKITSRTKVILPVHLFGLPCNMLMIQKIAKKHNLKVVEDACQSHGASINGKKVGSFGDMGCFSFYPTKNMFTGEGGMITTNSKLLYNKIRLLRNHGSDKQYYHKVVGFNYRMTDIAAAIGIVQLNMLYNNNAKRIKNAHYLSKRLSVLSRSIQLPETIQDFVHVFHQYSVVLKDKKLSRKRIIDNLLKRGVVARIYYPLPIHMQPAYKKMGYSDTYLIAENISKNIFSLPIHPGLSKKELDIIAQSLISEIS